ncbi:hypothetical protein, conserved [Trypanosoma brucei gambiense DAL972]|uniref:Sulfhydryl oxidase n=1 Tax=Trypanosoma brucei gambiense (strain MHOM/CI/86/DAL972) TaxID=679716 RepID=C9ZXU5_TRYB9|nr:hypothetical protein, conserved [Trypanosoma brucei gambiense DAL972]CBH14240.1 hypothetical protein, conserved [Trypanosoma brucei gambiense DAL972]|eukprot:XP_011776510.1 hypothetical protein, conserved [Trypanosoma brucei gambiense DAL972]
MSKREPLKKIPGECPTPRELGKAGWIILHSAAAVFPYNPTPTQQEAFRNFLHGWSHAYACSHCAYHMRRYFHQNPPVVTDKLALNRYLCEFHNAVNERVGNKIYDCDPMNVLRRWHPTFPDMEDQPTIEEQVKSLELKEKNETPQGVSDRWRQQNSSASPDGNVGRWSVGDARWTDTTNESRRTNVGEISAGWGTAGEKMKQRNGAGDGVSDAGASEKKWWRWGNSTSSSTTATIATPSAAEPAEDVEASVTSILSKLRACMVYCPDDKKSSA